MKLKILLNLILLTSSFGCFAMECPNQQTKSDYAKASTDRETFPWEKLPSDIKKRGLVLVLGKY